MLPDIFVRCEQTALRPRALGLAVKGTYENRMATVFWYLSDVESGGSTHFPRAGGLAHPPTTRGCKGAGRHVTPRAGRGIVFYSLTPDGFGAPPRLCKLRVALRKLSGRMHR